MPADERTQSIEGRALESVPAVPETHQDRRRGARSRKVTYHRTRDTLREFRNEAIAPVEANNGSYATRSPHANNHDGVARHKAKKHGKGSDEFAWSAHVNRHDRRMR